MDSRIGLEAKETERTNLNLCSPTRWEVGGYPCNWASGGESSDDHGSRGKLGLRRKFENEMQIRWRRFASVLVV